MNIDNVSAKVTPAGGNVFSHLGFSSEEAKNLKTESQRKISEEIAAQDALKKDFNGCLQEKSPR